jgi:hypothetical protein
MAKQQPLPRPAAADSFAFREPLSPKVVPIGRSGEPVIVVEGLMANVQELLDEAARAIYAPADGERGGYPGVRAPLPAGYFERLLRLADPLIRKSFNLPDIRFSGMESAFSMVTRPPGTLHPLQRLPHVDTSSPLRFALLHFLCDMPFGGTAFFRQDSTGLEQVGPADFAAYAAARRDRLADLPPNSAYPGPETPGYTRTAAFAARMDRLLIYRSFSLHSGIIAPDRPLPADPRSGRLTANVFADYVV